jgi:hypothetical protein
MNDAEVKVAAARMVHGVIANLVPASCSLPPQLALPRPFLFVIVVEKV